MKNFILLVLFFGLSLSSFSQRKNPKPYLSVPIIDLDKETSRQVIVDREDGQYLGHPTTVLLEDGKTILAVYPKGHGKGEIVYKRSTDGGLTWSERLKTPDSWKTSLEVPTIFRTIDPGGKKHLLLFSGLYPARLAHSEDDGLTWSELVPAGDWGGIVVMASITALNTGMGHYMALFHDDLRFMTADGQEKFREDRKKNEQMLFTLSKTFSYDGGLTWSKPEPIISRRDLNLCEPGMIRSPDGKRLAIFLRENSRKANSQIIFSKDEGITWTSPKPLPNELNGDRHVLKYTPDGRLLVVFRDVSPVSFRNEKTRPGSPTEGDWVGWVGEWRDLLKGRPGQYRIRFKDNLHDWDCCYPGVELLPDGTFVVTTYGHWEKDKEPYIISIRFKMEELDKKVKKH
ncbi:MAG TPA: glycosyl hydrolase [Bacteroidales bacterium]|nr:glycosyl hydrolase [Bacteroidales bacterium]HBZ22613.1 glycosyl hydrolase [Bacteroidales bacterium]